MEQPTPAKRKRLAWRRAWGIAVLAWAISRAAYFVVTWVGALLLVAAHPQSSGHGPSLDPMSPALVFSRWTLWDGHYYIGIANANYPTPIDAAFFPLFPLLIRVVELVPGVGAAHGLAAGLIVSNGAALGAFLALALLALDEGRFALGAERAMWLLAAYPLALFLAAVYTDSLFLALACAALLAARRGAWRWLPLWLALAALTRPTAFALVPAVAWEYGRQMVWPALQWIRVDPRDGLVARQPRALEVGLQALALLGVCGGYALGIGAFALYCRLHYGDALAFLHAERLFYHTPLWPWQTIGEVAREWRMVAPGGWRQARVLVDLVPVVLLAVATVAGARGRPVSFTVYLVAILEVCLLTPVVGAQFPDPLASDGRYVLAAVPLWLDLGRWSVRWPWLEHALVPLGWALQAILCVFVVTGGWLV